MFGKRSSSWNHFLETEKEKAKCKICRVVISIKHGNVCNMSRHLKAKHPELFGGAVTKAKVKKERVKPVRRYISMTGEIGFQRSLTGITRSPSWNHFVRLEGQRSKCKHCHGVLSIKCGNVCNMRRHLRLRHPEILEAEEEAQRSPTPKSPEQTPTSSEETQTQVQKVEPPEEPVDPDEEDATTIVEPPPEVLPKKSAPPASTEIFSEPLTPNRYRQINQQLVRMIIKESHPLNIVEHVEFKKFVSMLHPRYVIPSRKSLSTTHIPKLYENIKSEIRAKVSKASAVCVTTDLWTLRSVQHFLSVTAHFVDDDASLTPVLIECIEFPQSHTADDICRELKRIFSDWDIADKIVAVVTDNTEIIVSAVQKGNWSHLPCMTHTLDFVVKDALQEVGEVRNKCKSIVEFFKKNPHHSAALASFQSQMNMEPVELKQDVITRWNTTYEMLKGILASKEPIESSLAQLGADDNSLSSTDWNIIERTCEILRAFEEVSAEISDEKDVTLSKEFILISGLKLLLHEFNLKDVPKEVIAFTSRLLAGLNTHFGYLESNQLVLESALLDPRFKDHAFPSENVFNEAYQLLSGTASEAKVQQEPENPAPTTSSSSVWHYFEQRVRTSNATLNSIDGALVELDRYIQETHAPRDSNPFAWWSDRKVYYPRLYRIMKSRLCIVPSLPSERVFTKTGMLLCERQGKVSSLKMSQIVFLKFNLK